MSWTRSMYTDEQWKWLNDRYKEGHFANSLAKFANCHLNTMIYHWGRLGLHVSRCYMHELNREEFEALGRREA